MWDQVWRNALLATMRPSGQASGLGACGLIENGALAVQDGKIAWIGRDADLPETAPGGALARETFACEGRLLTPALVDCHTHLIFAGERAGEFARRMAGESYADISRAGGGIRTTTRATRSASEDALVEGALRRLDAMQAQGAGTIEIKSGYGLNWESEFKMLRAAGRLSALRPVRIVRTLLAAHALPEEFEHDRAAYVDLICETMIPEAANLGLAEAVDGFCEEIGFSAKEMARIFEAAQDAGLKVKLHAEQLSRQGGAELACRYNALSADHLEYASEDDARLMGETGVVAVLLPGASYFTRDPKQPPIAAFRRHGVRMAVASDCNPGTSPLASPLMAMNLACVLYGLTAEEALQGMTLHAAHALGLSDEIGALAVGMAADLALWRTHNLAELSYWMGYSPLERLVIAGRDAFHA